MAPGGFLILATTAAIIAALLVACWLLDRRAKPDEPFSREDDYGDRP